MADISIDYIDPITELWYAAYYGDVSKLQQLIADPIYKDQINYKENSQGHSALFFACYGAANPETIRVLLNAGADPFQRDGSGCLPLHYAANSLDPELIMALLEVPNMKDFRLNAAAQTGQTPLHALFIPASEVGLTVKSKNADLARCLPLFLERDNNPLGALHQKDNNGLSSLMLVKHYNLQSNFHQYVPSMTFGILLKSVSIPGNMTELLKSGFYNRIPILESDKDVVVRMCPRP